MGEDDLFRQARQGDRAALERLCRREWQPVYAIVYGAVQSRPEAEDLTQEVFARALRALDRYRETGVPFQAFLATIARNLVKDTWKGRHVVTVPVDQLPLQAGPDGDPERAALADVELAGLARAMASLSTDYQTVLRLRLLDECTTDEIAALMGRSPGAVRVLQHRALAALRGVLQKGAPR